MKEEDVLERFSRHTKETPELEFPYRIVFTIMGDLTDRRGLRQEWDNIDDDVKAELLMTLAGKVREVLHSR